MDQEEPRKTLRVVRALPFDQDGLMLRIRRGPQAKLAANLLSLLGGKVDSEIDESDEAAIRRELREEIGLSDDDIRFCSELAIIIGNVNTSDELLIATILFAVCINKSGTEVTLIPEGTGGKYDYDLQAIALTSPELDASDEWAFGYGYLLNMLLTGRGEFPQEIGTVQINQINVSKIRATLNNVRAED